MFIISFRRNNLRFEKKTQGEGGGYDRIFMLVAPLEGKCIKKILKRFFFNVFYVVTIL